jgi:type IV pilus assembly protein PilM
MKIDFKQALDLKREAVVGLDIGSSMVKMIAMARTGQGWRTTAASCIETGVTLQDDNESRGMKIASAIQAAMAACGSGTKLVVSSVCGPEIAVRAFSFPSLPREEIEAAVRLEADQVCPFDVSRNILDYQIVDAGLKDAPADKQDTATTSGVLVAATHEAVYNKLINITRANLNCVTMDVDGLALANCFENSMPLSPGQTVALVNIGMAFTNLVILRGGKLPFVRDLGRGGGDIIDRLSADMGLSRPNAMKQLRSPDEGIVGDLGRHLTAASTKLIADINETIRYYLIEQRLAAVDKVYICGGFAVCRPVMELLQKQLPYSVTLWNPFDTIGCDGDAATRDMLSKNGPALAIAAGLAMRTIKN